jgi:hypothetical protein
VDAQFARRFVVGVRPSESRSPATPIRTRANDLRRHHLANRSQLVCPLWGLADSKRQSGVTLGGSIMAKTDGSNPSVSMNSATLQIYLPVADPAIPPRTSRQGRYVTAGPDVLD